MAAHDKLTNADDTLLSLGVVTFLLLELIQKCKHNNFPASFYCLFVCFVGVSIEQRRIEILFFFFFGFLINC